MCRIFISLFYGLVILIPASSQKSKFEKLIPKNPKGWVSDFEKDFAVDQLYILDSIIKLHETETGNEIAIVTLQLDSIVIRSLKEFEELTLQLFNQWGVGKKAKNNGVALHFLKRLRRIRIEVGKGLESKLTDKEAKQIVDNIILPECRKSNYFDGTLKGLLEIIKEIK